MGGSQSREEVLIAQNAAGAGNNTIEQHLGLTNILLILMTTVLCCGALYGIYKLYYKCHKNWMHQEYDRRSMQRRLSWRRWEARKGPTADVV